MPLRDRLDNRGQTELVRYVEGMRGLRSDPAQTMTERPGMYRNYKGLIPILVLIGTYWGTVIFVAYALPSDWVWWGRAITAVVLVTLFLGVGLGTLIALDSHDVIELDEAYEREFWNE